MELSFLKAIAASVRGQTSSLKNQAKRLHTSSSKLFGTAYPLATCQEAVAVANGYRNWLAIEKLARTVGQDRSLPQWHIHHRSALHETFVKALVETDSEMSMLRPTVILGDVSHASLAAVCLWAEQISVRSVPGVVVIDTKERTFQKTPVGRAAAKLGMADMFQDFRIIDARLPSIALALTASPSQWIDALAGGLSRSDIAVLNDSKALVRLTRLMHLIAYTEWTDYWDDTSGPVSSDILIKAAHLLAHPAAIGNLLHTVEPSERESHWYHALARNAERNDFVFPPAEFANLLALIQKIGEVASGVGIVYQQESLHRPTVVLCDSDNPASMVLATLVSGMYYHPFAADRGHRPLLYVSTQNSDALPHLLHFGNESIVCNGQTDCHAPVWNSYQTRSPLFIESSEDGILVSGKFASTGASA